MAAMRPPHLTRRAMALAAVLSLLAPAGLMAQIQTSAPPFLSVADAHAAASAGKMVLIDIRSPPEWKETGVPKSAHAITMHQKRDDLLAALAKATGGSKARPIALICATGSRSSFLTGWLRSQGYTAISDVAEGVMGGRNGKGWLKSSLPMRQWTPEKTAPDIP